MKENYRDYPVLFLLLQKYMYIYIYISTLQFSFIMRIIRDSYVIVRKIIVPRMPSKSANKNDDANNCDNDKSKFLFSVCQHHLTFFMHTFMRCRTSDLDKPHCVE